MGLIASIAGALSADSALTAIVADRIYTRDVRMTGWDARPAAFDADGELLPCLIVLDGPATPEAFGGAVEVTMLSVWAYGPRTPAGETAVGAAMERVKEVLNLWQDGPPGPYLRYAGRWGRRADESSWFDRMTFAAREALVTARM